LALINRRTFKSSSSSLPIIGSRVSFFWTTIILTVGDFRSLGGFGALAADLSRLRASEHSAHFPVEQNRHV
jgi:hypothetical protein